MPRIVARATDSIHARVLQKVGADRVIQPEREIGATRQDHGLAGSARLCGPRRGRGPDRSPGPESVAGQVPLRTRPLPEDGLTVLALKPKGGPGSLPHGDTVLRDGDVLVVGGSRNALDRSPLVQPDGT